jgi:DNA-binding response OmpR family regulator
MSPSRRPSGRFERVRRVIVAEDDVDCLRALEVLLAHPLIAIDPAASAAQALAKAAADPPDAILLDAGLAAGGGLDVPAQPAGGEGARAPRVILMNAGRASGQAADRWLGKPLALEELQKAVLEALGLASEKHERAPEPPPELPRRLLIAEDDLELLATLRDFLAHPHVAVETAADGAEAVERAWARKPHAILLDVKIPLLSGFDVFIELRRARFFPRILLMSGRAEPSLFRSAMELGAYACLEKPLDPAALRETVLRALGIAGSSADRAAR